MSEPLPPEAVTPRDPGWNEWLYIIDEARRVRIEAPEDITRLVGMKGLNWLIRDVLDTIYPKDIFGDGSIVEPMWMSNEGGREFNPGVRWVALLRAALKEVKA